MQQMNPQQGHLFPDKPQAPAAPRFASNMPQTTQAYEPQQRMQQTGAIPVIPQQTGSFPVLTQQTGSMPVLQMPQYPTGQLRTLHTGTPVTQLPPMSTMPTAQAYQTQQAQQAAQQAAGTIAGTPLVVHTVQGIAVAVTAEEMQRALDELAAKSGKQKQADQAQEGKQAKKQKQKVKGKQKREGKFVMKFSVAWCAFGLIGIFSALCWLLEWVIIPVLVYLTNLTGGAA